MNKQRTTNMTAFLKDCKEIIEFEAGIFGMTKADIKALERIEKEIAVLDRRMMFRRVK